MNDLALELVVMFMEKLKYKDKIQLSQTCLNCNNAFKIIKHKIKQIIKNNKNDECWSCQNDRYVEIEDGV